MTLSAWGPYNATPGEPPKPELREKAVQRAMSYLHSKDAPGLKSLIPEGFKNPEAAAEYWITIWGGVDATGYDVTYASPGGTTFSNTTIHAKGADGSAVTIPLWLSWIEDHWGIGYFPEKDSPTPTKGK